MSYSLLDGKKRRLKFSGLKRFVQRTVSD